MRNKIMLLGPLAAFLAVAPNAGATLQLSLSSGGSTVAINDNSGICGAGGDCNPFIGHITFIGGIGNWFINVTTGTVGANPIIDLNSVDTVGGSGTGINALTLQFSSTDFQPPANGFSAMIGGTLASGSSLTFDAYANTNNLLNAKQSEIGSQFSFGPDGAFSGTEVGGPAMTSPYSATEVVVISANTSGTTSFDAAIDVVPEPASVVLLGGVLLATVSAIRRKVGRRRV